MFGIGSLKSYQTSKTTRDHTLVEISGNALAVRYSIFLNYSLPLFIVRTQTNKFKPFLMRKKHRSVDINFNKSYRLYT